MALIPLEQFIQENPDARLLSQPSGADSHELAGRAPSPDTVHHETPLGSAIFTTSESGTRVASPDQVDGSPAADTPKQTADILHGKKRQILIGLGLTVLGITALTPLAKQAANSGWNSSAKPLAEPLPSVSAPKVAGASTSKNKAAISSPAQPLAPSTLNIPTAWGNCSSDQVIMSVASSAGIRVPVTLKNGKVGTVMFANPNAAAGTSGHKNMLPQAFGVQLVAASACLSVDRSPSTPVVSRNGDQIIINRSAFMTVPSLLNTINGYDSHNKITVQGFGSKTHMAQSTSISPQENARINSILSSGGTLNKAYGETVAYELVDAELNQASTSPSTKLTQDLDSLEVRNLQLANPSINLRKIIFSGQYPSLASQWEAQHAKLNLLNGVVLVNPTSTAVVVNERHG